MTETPHVRSFLDLVLELSTRSTAQLSSPELTAATNAFAQGVYVTTRGERSTIMLSSLEEVIRLASARLEQQHLEAVLPSQRLALEECRSYLDSTSSRRLEFFELFYSETLSMLYSRVGLDREHRNLSYAFRKREEDGNFNLQLAIQALEEFVEALKELATTKVAKLQAAISERGENSSPDLRLLDALSVAQDRVDDANYILEQASELWTEALLSRE